MITYVVVYMILSADPDSKKVYVTDMVVGVFIVLLVTLSQILTATVLLKYTQKKTKKLPK